MYNNTIFIADSGDDIEDSFWGPEYPSQSVSTNAGIQYNQLHPAPKQDSNYGVFAFLFIIAAVVLIAALYFITKPKKMPVRYSSAPIRRGSSAGKKSVKKFKMEIPAPEEPAADTPPQIAKEAVSPVKSNISAEDKTIQAPEVQEEITGGFAAEIDENDSDENNNSGLGTPENVQDCVQSFLEITKDI